MPWQVTPFTSPVSAVHPHDERVDGNGSGRPENMPSMRFCRAGHHCHPPVRSNDSLAVTSLGICSVEVILCEGRLNAHSQNSPLDFIPFIPFLNNAR